MVQNLKFYNIFKKMIIVFLHLCTFNEFPVNIKRTHDDPLFQANQIAKILNIKNISKSVVNLNENEKVITNSYTLGGEQKCLFFNFIHVV